MKQSLNRNDESWSSRSQMRHIARGEARRLLRHLVRIMRDNNKHRAFHCIDAALETTRTRP